MLFMATLRAMNEKFVGCQKDWWICDYLFSVDKHQLIKLTIAAAQKIYFFLLLNIPKEYIYMLATPLYICWFVHFQVYNCVIVAHSYSPSSRNHGSRWPIVSVYGWSGPIVSDPGWGLTHCFGLVVGWDPRESLESQKRICWWLI